MSRGKILGAVAAVWLAGAAAIAAGAFEGPPVEVVHWANGHMMNDALLPKFAAAFNKAGHRTDSGKKIKVQLHTANSGVTTCQLIRRVNPIPCDDNEGTGGQDGNKLPNPTIVTPVADHWLPYVNHMAGRTVVDMAVTKPLAVTWIGILTEARMAECLGWPRQEIGFADVVALRNHPDGWASCPTAKAAWGRTPLISYTDPNSSSTGRSLLFAHYAIAAGKRPEQLTLADVNRADVVEQVRRFQRAVDHYTPDTLILNSKIVLGPQYGHIHFVAEDNLVKLYQGKVKVTEGNTTKARPLDRDMVFIYPKEGSTPHNHSAGIVQAPWVHPEQREAAAKWTAYLREEPQQQAFMQEGFRPATNIPYVRPEGSRFAPDPAMPKAVLDTNATEPAAGGGIVDGWGDIKNPGVVTFVLDVSGSMSGKKIDEAKRGMVLALDAIHRNNLAGLVTFSDGIKTKMPLRPISENKLLLAETIKKASVGGGTALYEAIAEAVRMTDAADAPADAIRGVVVLTDGHATAGLSLDQLIRITNKDEQPVATCRGFQADAVCGESPKNQLLGKELAFPTRHRVHIFFVGVGDADFEIGRMLAEATGAAFKGAKESDLAAVLEQFGKYF